MDIREIKRLAVDLRGHLRDRGIHVDGIILFGSYASGTATANSDIDLAIVSRNFGKDRLKETSIVNLVAVKVCPLFEVVPIGVSEYLDKNSISPILHEIKTTGTPLF